MAAVWREVSFGNGMVPPADLIPTCGVEVFDGEELLCILLLGMVRWEAGGGRILSRLGRFERC